MIDSLFSLDGTAVRVRKLKIVQTEQDIIYCRKLLSNQQQRAVMSSSSSHVLRKLLSNQERSVIPSPSSSHVVQVIASNGKDQNVEFDETTTLPEFSERVLAQVFGVKQQLNEAKYATQVPYDLRLIWCGVHIKPGASWHTGIVQEDDLMKDLSPGTTGNGGRLPVIHANLIGELSPASENV
jgi:hypothetical protein